MHKKYFSSPTQPMGEPNLCPALLLAGDNTTSFEDVMSCYVDEQISHW